MLVTLNRYRGNMSVHAYVLSTFMLALRSLKLEKQGHIRGHVALQLIHGPDEHGALRNVCMHVTICGCMRATRGSTSRALMSPKYKIASKICWEPRAMH